MIPVKIKTRHNQGSFSKKILAKKKLKIKTKKDVKGKMKRLRGVTNCSSPQGRE
ncbi:hypothetical protein ISS85_03685 [Candidatus Microgenomates bacterium]|nr:hypothetical protein [Candidatus Microgenomates bacterium]